MAKIFNLLALSSSYSNAITIMFPNINSKIVISKNLCFINLYNNAFILFVGQIRVKSKFSFAIMDCLKLNLCL
jgi:hypothetical protein